MLRSVIVSSLLVSVAVAQKFVCPPDADGLFEDPEQCDKYYDCYEGTQTEKLCPDGHVFDLALAHKREPCDHYFLVECGNRVKLQEPKGRTDQCPRLNGVYAHPDPAVCNIFYECDDGVAEEYICPVGTWFDDFMGVCNWPVNTKRTGCGQIDNICTKAQSKLGGNQLTSDPHPKLPDPEDCAKFYICLNGVKPRLQGCELGLVYNTVTQACDAPENVPECKDYYAFLDEEEAAVAAKKQPNQ